MQLKKTISLFFIFLLGFNGNSQNIVKAEGGSFEDFVSWGNGFLGIVQTQLYAVIPNYRHFQYFDENGKLLWNTKIEPDNFNNKYICNSNSDYAYFINKPTGKKAKNTLFTIYQIDKEGKVNEKAINYSENITALLPFSKNLNTIYLGAYKDGFIAVLSNDEFKYHIIKINSKLVAEYQAIDIEWDNKLFESNQLSKPKFVLGDDMFCIIQSKLKENELTSKTYKLAYDNFNNLSNSIHHFNIKGYDLYAYGCISDEVYEKSKFNDQNLSYAKTKGGKTTVHPSLGLYLNFCLTENGLKLFCSYKNLKSGSESIIEKSGVISFDLQLNGEENNGEIESEYLSENDKSKLSYYVKKNGECVIISYLESACSVKINDGDGVSYRKDLPNNVALCLFLKDEDDTKFTGEFNYVLKSNDTYYLIKFDGMKNSYGNSKDVIINKL